LVDEKNLPADAICFQRGLGGILGRAGGDFGRLELVRGQPPQQTREHRNDRIGKVEIDEPKRPFLPPALAAIAWVVILLLGSKVQRWGYRLRDEGRHRLGRIIVALAASLFVFGTIVLLVGWSLLQAWNAAGAL